MLTRPLISEIQSHRFTAVKLSSCLIINLTSVKHPYEHLNCDSTKALNRIGFFLNGGNLASLVKALNFLLDFEQILDICLSNFRLVSNVILRSLTLSFPKLYLYPILTAFVEFYSLLLRDGICWC